MFYLTPIDIAFSGNSSTNDNFNINNYQQQGESMTLPCCESSIDHIGNCKSCINKLNQIVDMKVKDVVPMVSVPSSNVVPNVVPMGVPPVPSPSIPPMINPLPNDDNKKAQMILIYLIVIIFMIFISLGYLLHNQYIGMGSMVLLFIVLVSIMTWVSYFMIKKYCPNNTYLQ